MEVAARPGATTGGKWRNEQSTAGRRPILLHPFQPPMVPPPPGRRGQHRPPSQEHCLPACMGFVIALLRYGLVMFAACHVFAHERTNINNPDLMSWSILQKHGLGWQKEASSQDQWAIILNPRLSMGLFLFGRGFTCSFKTHLKPNPWLARSITPSDAVFKELWSASHVQDLPSRFMYFSFNLHFLFLRGTTRSMGFCGFHLYENDLQRGYQKHMWMRLAKKLLSGTF